VGEVWAGRSRPASEEEAAQVRLGLFVLIATVDGELAVIVIVAADPTQN